MPEIDMASKKKIYTVSVLYCILRAKLYCVFRQKYA